jgi:oligopeptide transport system substrate-binding protein
MSGEPSTLDPVLGVDAFSTEVLRDLYEGLTAESPDGEIVPGASAKWTISPDGLQYTFTIRSDAKWSNGQRLRAQDFVQTWQRIVNPRTASPDADDLRLIRGASDIIAGKAAPATLGVRALGDATLLVDLERPAPYFLQILAHSSTFPVYSDVSAASHSRSTWVSNGAYILQMWSPATQITLTKNPLYWDHEHVAIPEVRYFFMSDETAQYSRYRDDQLDLTDSVPPNAASALRSAHPNELVVSPFLATAYYGLNLAAEPLRTNVYLRQALAMALDRRQLTQFLQFGQAPAYGIVPPGTSNYTRQEWPWKNLNDDERVAAAKLLFARAGYSASRPLHLRLLYNSNPVIKNIAVATAAMWKDVLGIDTELNAEEYRVFLDSRHDKSRWEVARLAWTADYNDASNFLDVFRGSSPNNDEGFSDDNFDAALEAAAATADPKARRLYLEQSEQLLLKAYPILPIYYFVSKRLVKPDLNGVRMNPLNHIASKHLSFSTS